MDRAPWLDALPLQSLYRSALSVVAHERTLLISGERRRPSVQGAVYQQMEVEYGPFQRQVRLSEDVDPERATATYDRGMLTIVLPIVERPPAVQGRVTIVVSRL